MELVHGAPVYRLRGILLLWCTSIANCNFEEHEHSGRFRHWNHELSCYRLKAGSSDSLVDDIAGTEEIVVKPLVRTSQGHQRIPAQPLWVTAEWH